ncbi:hypothetical protein E2C01_066684 [Portunus trituberculatus]|uniref:Uncharacterized protein n=1 Tax=Portunus trituberculatus TaxID=210409 RepID=A0A5B7HIT5_PORTR|nr:hypothetical protein [Portunus trituberculatus]
MYLLTYGLVYIICPSIVLHAAWFPRGLYTLLEKRGKMGQLRGEGGEIRVGEGRRRRRIRGFASIPKPA